ncbi:MAG: hypothetical protein JF606_25375 [Burkholderiales bacterium]|nr:hypothetical protein [Burkholderiales bacterium]
MGVDADPSGGGAAPEDALPWPPPQASRAVTMQVTSASRLNEIFEMGVIALSVP